MNHFFATEKWSQSCNDIILTPQHCYFKNQKHYKQSINQITLTILPALSRLSRISRSRERCSSRSLRSLSSRSLRSRSSRSLRSLSSRSFLSLSSLSRLSLSCDEEDRGGGGPGRPPARWGGGVRRAGEPRPPNGTAAADPGAGG